MTPFTPTPITLLRISPVLLKRMDPRAVPRSVLIGCCRAKTVGREMFTATERKSRESPTQNRSEINCRRCGLQSPHSQLGPWHNDKSMAQVHQTGSALMQVGTSRIEAQQPTPNPEIPKKHRVRTNFFKKFARTFAFFPVIRVRNPTEIVQKNFFR